MAEGERDGGWFAPNLGKDKEHPKWPDWKGIVWLGGVKYELAGWTRTNERGKFLSLSLSPFREREAATKPDDEIPF